MMVVGGHLVVAGGYAEGLGHLTSVEAYTPTGWTPLPPLPHAANRATACVLNGRLYVMGGIFCNKLQVLEMSEENEFTWTVKADLPAARYGAASAAHESKIWLMGGRVDYVESSSVLIYDIDTDSWGTGPAALPRASSEARATTMNGELYITGGTSRATWVYRNGAWVDAPDDHAPQTQWAARGSIRLG